MTSIWLVSLVGGSELMSHLEAQATSSYRTCITFSIQRYSGWSYRFTGSGDSCSPVRLQSAVAFRFYKVTEKWFL